MSSRRPGTRREHVPEERKVTERIWAWPLGAFIDTAGHPAELQIGQKVTGIASVARPNVKHRAEVIRVEGWDGEWELSGADWAECTLGVDKRDPSSSSPRKGAGQ
jgi:hypothetical protein